MKVLFCRNTHDENGKFYWYLENVDIQTHGLGVHALTKDGVTFDQYIKENIDYQKANPFDYNIPTKIPTYINLLEDLILMIKLDVCVVKEVIDDN